MINSHQDLKLGCGSVAVGGKMIAWQQINRSVRIDSLLADHKLSSTLKHGSR